MEMHQQINGIISIVSKNIWMIYISKELLKCSLIFFLTHLLIEDLFI